MTQKRARSLMTRRKGKLSLMQLFGNHKTSILINDGPSFCYCTYVLRISDLVQMYFLRGL